jgi:hypothetical protein
MDFVAKEKKKLDDFNENISFEEKSELIDDEYLLNDDSNNFPLPESDFMFKIEQQQQHQQVKKQQIEQHQLSNNSIQDIYFTNSSSISTTNDQNQNNIEIYDNLLMLQTNKIKEEEEELREYGFEEIENIDNEEEERVNEAEETPDEFFIISNKNYKIVEQEPFYFNEPINNDQQIEEEQLQQQQYEITSRLSNIIEEEDDDDDDEYDESSKQKSARVEEEEESPSASSTTSTIEYSIEPLVKNQIIQPYNNNNNNVPPTANLNEIDEFIKNDEFEKNEILDILIEKLNEQQQKKFENVNDDVDDELFNKYYKKSLEEEVEEEELLKRNFNYHNNDEDEYQYNDLIDEDDDDRKYEENGKGYTVFYDSDCELKQEKEIKKRAITTLTLETKTNEIEKIIDEMNEENNQAIVSCQDEKDIILIGERADIQKLLLNDNNQLTNFIINQSHDDYDYIAKQLVDQIVDSSLTKMEDEEEQIAQIEKTSKLETDEDFIDYYKNLEKNLLLVRNEIDQLKQEAYDDLEFIKKILNTNDSLSDNSITNNQQQQLLFLTAQSNEVEDEEEEVEEDEEDTDKLINQKSYNNINLLDDSNTIQFYSAIDSLNATTNDLTLSNDTLQQQQQQQQHNYLIRPNQPAPPVPNFRQTIKLKQKEPEEEEEKINKNYENINNINKSIILPSQSSSPTTTTTNNINSFKSLHNLNNKNIIEKNIIDKCLKSASYNVSSLNLNQYNNQITTKQINNNNNKTCEKEQQILTNKIITPRNSEKVFLNLQNQVNNNKESNEYRVPSSRHFCGRLLSTNLTLNTETNVKMIKHTEKSKSISINCLNNDQQQQQPTYKMRHRHESDENLKLNNENENFKNSTLSLSKSIKDLRFYVSNSYSPSLIIKPPLSPVIVNGTSHTNSHNNQIENDKININYQYQPKQQQLTVPIPSKRSSSVDHHHQSNTTTTTRRSAPIVKQSEMIDDRKYPILNAKNVPTMPNNRNIYKIELTDQHQENILNDKDEILIDCILDMKAPSSPPLRPPQQPAPPIPASRTMPNIKQQQQNFQYSSTFKPNQVYKENNENINYGFNTK